jgi:hypothetical protein
MKVFVVMTLGLTAQTIAFAQNPSPSRVLAGTQVPKQGTGIKILEFAYVPQTLKELRDYSEVIVEGTVESKMPAREHGPGLETDVLVAVNRVVKGEPTLQRIVLTEQGGTLGAYQEIIQDDNPMRSSEHYVFFLLSDKRVDIPAIAGRKRYSAVCASLGKARIIGTKIVISAASSRSLKDTYDGVTTDQFLNAILAQ